MVARAANSGRPNGVGDRGISPEATLLKSGLGSIPLGILGTFGCPRAPLRTCRRFLEGSACR